MILSRISAPLREFPEWVGFVSVFSYACTVIKNSMMIMTISNTCSRVPEKADDLCDLSIILRLFAIIWKYLSKQFFLSPFLHLFTWILLPNSTIYTMSQTALVCLPRIPAVISLLGPRSLRSFLWNWIDRTSGCHRHRLECCGRLDLVRVQRAGIGLPLAAILRRVIFPLIACSSTSLRYGIGSVRSHWF